MKKLLQHQCCRGAFILMRTLSIQSFLAVLLASIGYAHTLSGQEIMEKKISVDFDQVPLKKALGKIERAAGVKFTYSPSLISEDAAVSFSASHQDLGLLLDGLLDPLGISYKLIANRISLYKEAHLQPTSTIENRQQENPAIQAFTVTGTVQDENSVSIPGVNVVEKGTTNGTTTDFDGKFSINLADENAVLVFSFIGYEPQEVAINGRSVIGVTLKEEITQLDAVVVIGYGTAKKGDLTGSVASVSVEDFKTQPMVQVTDMLAGRVAGFNTSQGTSAAGGGSLEIRGPKSLSAGTEPLIVLDGAIFTGSLRDINPNDIEAIDILKDASSAAVFGSKAASGVVLITTKKGKTGKPVINVSTKLGITENNNERRGLNSEEYIRFRQDYFRQMFPNIDYNFYTHPDNLPAGMTIDEWRGLSASPVDDNILEWMGRLRLFPEEQANYLAGKTMDMYDEVFRKGVIQQYDVSISGGAENVTYYWSVGYNDNEGIRVGDQYSSIRSRLNVDFQITEWLNAGVNTQFSDRDESSVPASLNFYVNSPYGEMWDAEGNLKRYPHGHSDNPLLNYYRTSRMDKNNNLFASMYANVKLPFGFDFKVSFQPRYQARKYLSFTRISEQLGAVPNEIPSGERRESSIMNYMVDNLLTWKRQFGDHSFDVTLLANIEKNQYWATSQTNRNFQPNQQLGYHGLQFGDSPGITNSDSTSTGDALMARVNYNLKGKYLVTASVRRDGYSAFGTENPRATFPAFALAWVLSEESFFKVAPVNRMKLRLSWGVNGNRDIGMYAALANTGSSLWYDGSNTRVGVYNTTLANPGLRWERTASLNVGLDVSLLQDKIDLTADYYDMTTTDLLMNRILPRVTGFSNITTNLGELGNRGFEMTISTRNINNDKISWNSNFVFSLNRNKIKELFGDVGNYRLLGEDRYGAVPDYSNGWFPGQPVDVVWDYDVVGIWQTGEEGAAAYGLQPGDFKAVDVNGDGKYVNLDDKKFIGYEAPRYRLGLRNEVTFLKNFTASVFVRADLGHIAPYRVALNSGYESNDRWNRNNGPVPYWTADRPDDEYARLNPILSAFGGGLMIYKPRSFVRIQDVSLMYNLPEATAKRLKLNMVNMFVAVRNLATFTKWPGWDPESAETDSQDAGMTPMPRTYTFGLSFSL